MITQTQVEALAKDSRVDSFTIMREYLQLLFLSYLYQEAENPAFILRQKRHQVQN